MCQPLRFSIFNVVGKQNKFNKNIFSSYNIENLIRIPHIIMETLKKKITENILKIVRNKTINIIVCNINTYTDLASEKYSSVPHLDIFTIIKVGYEFDIALKTAIDQDEFGYVSDLYGFEDDEYIEEEIGLDLIYFPDWPNNIDNNDAIIISILREIVDKNTNKFNHIERFYFHHYNDFDIVTILKK